MTEKVKTVIGFYFQFRGHPHPDIGTRLTQYFRRLNNQNRLSVTDSTMSINSTTSTETPSTVRAVTSGDQEDLSKSQEDLLANDNASVASGNRY